MFEKVKEFLGAAPKPDLVIPARDDWYFLLPHGRFRILSDGKLSGKISAWCPVLRQYQEYSPEGHRLCHCQDALDGVWDELKIVELPWRGRGMQQAGTSRILDTEVLENSTEVAWVGDGAPGRNSSLF